jgi:3D (Asp-Asp-Asp) domain-containing protein
MFALRIALRRLLLAAFLCVVAAMLFACACGGTEHTDSNSPRTEVVAQPAPEPIVKPLVEDIPEIEMPADVVKAKDALGTFKLTYYWMASEADTGDDRPANTTLYSPQCKPIAHVSRKFARHASLEGTGVLRDGRTINVARKCDCGYSPCFFVAEPEYRWGAGVGSRPLSPFRSIAVDPRRIKIGTTVYIAELDGLAMPGVPPWGGFIHDGCVIAEDTGGGIKGRQIDLFMAREANYRAVFARHHINRVTVYDGTGHCGESRGEVVAANRNSI